MTDLPARAARAGVTVTILENPEDAGPCDLILTDVPCSGSGSWRRDPEGKWRLTPAMLADLARVQDGILDRAAPTLARAARWPMRPAPSYARRTRTASPPSWSATRAGPAG